MKIFNSIINFGIKPEYGYDEKLVIRKINIIFFVGYLLIFASFLIENYFEIREYNDVFCTVLLLSWIVPYKIYRGKIIMSVYCYFFIAFSFFSVLTLMMGLESNVIYFILIMIFSLNNILSNKLFVHHLFKFYIIIIVVLLFVFYMLIWNKYIIYRPLDDSRFVILKYYNTVMFFITAMSFAGFLTYESYLNDVKIKKILHQKEVLLSEVYHRVKNNLNIINSLFNLKKNSSGNPEIKELMEEFRQRIFSISTLYEKLIHKENDKINIREYLYEIIREYDTIYNHENKISINAYIDSVQLSMNKSMPLGLIINELITNSLKHNLNQHEPIEISMQLKFDDKSNQIHFSYSDNSKGKLRIPESKMFSDDKSFGINIILLLIEQLQGKFLIKNENKIDLKIIFPFDDNF